MIACKEKLSDPNASPTRGSASSLCVLVPEDPKCMITGDVLS
jgi:hypothetical protein